MDGPVTLLDEDCGVDGSAVPALRDVTVGVRSEGRQPRAVDPGPLHQPVDAGPFPDPEVERDDGERGGGREVGEYLPDAGVAAESRGVQRDCVDRARGGDGVTNGPARIAQSSAL